MLSTYEKGEIFYMPVFVIMIVFSLFFYIYYKVKYVRANRPNEKKWLSAKSSVALGSFVAFFGLNRLFITQSAISIIISVLFLTVGGISIWTGIKAYKFYLPYVQKERESIEKSM